MKDEDFIDLSIIRDLLGGENIELENSLLNTFMTDTLTRYENIKESLEISDCKKINYLSHTIKGGAGNIGAKLIHHTCNIIERMATENDLKSMDPHVIRLGKEITQLKNYIDDNCQ